MDRTKYLANLYTKEDKALIRVFQKEMQKLDLLYFRAINSSDLTKANAILTRIKEIAKKLKEDYWERADSVIPREYLKGARYIDDLVDRRDTLSLINNADNTEIRRMIKAMWPIHWDAVHALLNTSKNYVKSSLDWMERQALTMVWELQQQKIREELAWGMLSWLSLQKMENRVKKYFFDNRITWFKDRSWRLWSMDRYVDMLTRTETSIANVQWTINRAIQLWITKFRIVEQVDCCEKCAEYNWDIVDVKNWTVSLPPFHPNCRWYIIAVLEWF